MKNYEYNIFYVVKNIKINKNLRKRFDRKNDFER